MKILIFTQQLKIYKLKKSSISLLLYYTKKLTLCSSKCTNTSWNFLRVWNLILHSAFSDTYLYIYKFRSNIWSTYVR